MPKTLGPYCIFDENVQL